MNILIDLLMDVLIGTLTILVALGTVLAVFIALQVIFKLSFVGVIKLLISAVCFIIVTGAVGNEIRNQYE